MFVLTKVVLCHLDMYCALAILQAVFLGINTLQELPVISSLDTK